MNREQARREIDSLDYYLQNHTDDYGEESHTAMMMAIKALEQQICEDAIRREAAIDAMYHHFCDKSREECAQILHEVPSVNPQANKEDIHREREQAYMRGYEDGSRKYRIEPCEDAISRQAALDLCERFDGCVPYSILSSRDMLPSVSTEETDDYKQGWHDAICKALDEAYDIVIDGERFSVVQEETLIGLGMAYEQPYVPEINVGKMRESEDGENDG